MRAGGRQSCRHYLAAAPQHSPGRTPGELDPLIHVSTRLKIVATLAALPDGGTLSFTRLQDMLGLKLRSAHWRSLVLPGGGHRMWPGLFTPVA